MRGYFGIGAEGISKAMNLGSLWRTAHAFEASFLFTVAAACPTDRVARADTSQAWREVPLYPFADIDAFALPRGCQLVGVEIADEAVDLPSFRHPRCAAYVLGPERSSLSPAMRQRCVHLVRIPTRFAINLAIAGSLVMYDRMISLGRFPRRAEWPGGPAVPVPPAVFGKPRFRHQR